MHTLTLSLILFTALLIPGGATAQSLSAQIKLTDQTVTTGSLNPRKAGTSILQLRLEGSDTLRNLEVLQVAAIQFDLSAFDPANLSLQYLAGNYPAVIDGLKGRIVPYFSFVDMETNSNPLIELFIKALYRSGNHQGVHIAGKEIAKYDLNGNMRRISDIYRGLSFLAQGDLKEFAAYAHHFEDVNPEDPLASALWLGQSRFAELQERTEEIYPPLARIIVERPMETEWSAEALYLSAVHHHTRTNLVVANQICQEIKIVAPLTPWPDEAEKLQARIQNEAAALNIALTDFGELRKAEKEAGDAKIDYRERQRALEAQELETTE